MRKRSSLTYRDTIDLKSLWPHELTAKVSDSELVSSECDLEFSAANTQGSTHDFELRGLKLSSFVSAFDPLYERRFKNAFKVQENRQPSRADLISVRSESDLLAETVEKLVVSIGTATRVSLNCEGSSVSVDRTTDSRETVAALITKAGHSGQHYCHFIATKEDEPTNVFAMSADALMRFSNLQLQIGVTPSFPNFVSSTTLKRIEIRNANTEEAYVLVPHDPLQLRVQEVYSYQNNLYANPNIGTHSLRADVQGATPVANDRYRIAPGATAIVELRFSDFLGTRCVQVGLGMSPAPRVGLSWGAVADYSILQLDEGDDTSGAAIFTMPLSRPERLYPESYLSEALHAKFGAAVPVGIAIAPPLLPIERCL